MRVKISGVLVEEEKTLRERFEEVVEETYQLIDSKNREIRRSKGMKRVMTIIPLVSSLGFSSIANAEGYGVGLQGGQDALEGLKTANEAIKGIHKIGVPREHSLIWNMNEWFEKVLLHTQNLFDVVQVQEIFHSIWMICMSFTTLIFAKKGFDMIKAKVMGSTNIGGIELIIRLLASMVMTFLSLDIMEFGIEASNKVLDVFFDSMKNSLIPYEALEQSGKLGIVFWSIGYILMFFIISLQYWIRQITIVLVGLMTPIVNTAWVTDGGAMLGTLIREFITLITTPLVHGAILTIGSVFMFEVTSLTGNAFFDSMNSILIGFSTMFLMVFTPSVLRKFTTGTQNPLRWATALGKGTYGNALKLMKLFK